MATAGRVRPRFTYEQYLANEYLSVEKHEFHDGEIYMRAFSNTRDSGLSANAICALHTALEDSPYQVFTSDIRIFVEAARLATYPDASVFGEIDNQGPDHNVTALNPIVLVEVTNDVSEVYDRTFKLDAYRSIPSLRDYVIVSHREPRITVHRRDDQGWSVYEATAGQRIALASIGVELDVEAIYRRR